MRQPSVPNMWTENRVHPHTTNDWTITAFNVSTQLIESMVLPAFSSITPIPYFRKIKENIKFNGLKICPALSQNGSLTY
jgi:hypothetical protein